MTEALSVLKDKYNVSHETLCDLSSFHDLLLKWQKRLNLISPKTTNEIWDRHILDSAQLCSFLPKKPCCILDIGSGAGLPGVVLSILTNHEIHLVESDRKKCAFLRTALSRVNSNALVHETRLEEMSSLRADIITARAFAPLQRLLALTQKQHHPKLRFLLLKGRDVNSELINIESWQKIRVVNQHASITSEDGCILELQFNNTL